MAATTARVTFTKTKTFTFTVDYPNYVGLSNSAVLTAANLPNGALAVGELLAGSTAQNGAIADTVAWAISTNTAIEPYTTWSPNTALAVGARISPTTPTDKLYTATAGTTGATEPTWPTTNATTVVNGGVTFTCISKF